MSKKAVDLQIQNQLEYLILLFKKTTMNHLVFLIIFAGFVSCIGVHAQQIVYAYDASGNCISRTYQGQAPSSIKSSVKDDVADVNLKQNFETILLTEENSIRIFPNPNGGQFQIEMTGFDDVLAKGTVSIFSSRGLPVLKIITLQKINTFNLNNQPNGTYVLQINLDGKIFTHKVIISK